MATKVATGGTKQLKFAVGIGIILTVLGIAGLIYFATLFMNAKGTEGQVKTLLVYGGLGAIFFFTGIGLIRTTKDDARPPVS